MLSVVTVLGYIFVAAGVLFFCFTVAGLFRFDFVMNRMHSAAMGDGLALGLVMIGLALINGFVLSSLKFLAAGLLMFFSSPVSAHLIARYEVEADDALKEHCEVDEECRY